MKNKEITLVILYTKKDNQEEIASIPDLFLNMGFIVVGEKYCKSSKSMVYCCEREVIGDFIVVSTMQDTHTINADLLRKESTTHRYKGLYHYTFGGLIEDWNALKTIHWS